MKNTTFCFKYLLLLLLLLLSLSFPCIIPSCTKSQDQRINKIELNTIRTKCRKIGFITQRIYADTLDEIIYSIWIDSTAVWFDDMDNIPKNIKIEKENK